MSLQPTAPYWTKSIDCRHLQLNFEFYELNAYEVLCLSHDLVDWIEQSWDASIVPVWKHMGRNVRPQSLSEKMRIVLSQNLSDSWSMQACVRSSDVYNTASLNRYLSKIHRCADRRMGVSDDFSQYWAALFPNGKCENAEFCQRILKLFSAPNKYSTSLYAFPDIQAHMCTFPHTHKKDAYYGSFFLSIGACCLNAQLAQTAEIFLDQLQKISIQYSHINGRVMLQPFTLPIGQSPYMTYFGNHCAGDGSYIEAEQQVKEWYTTYYICGVEWANIISPKARVHIENIVHDSANYRTIHCCEMPNKSIQLRSTKLIDIYDVEDAMLLKKLVYPGLYPGCTQFLLRNLFPWDAASSIPNIYPRQDWAIVPVFADEISILGNTLTFHASNRCII